MRGILICTDKIESIEWQDLVPRQRTVIVPRFTLLIEDLVISRYQVTQLFCSRYCFASASSAKSPCDCGSQADFAISVDDDTPLRADNPPAKSTTHKIHHKKYHNQLTLTTTKLNLLQVPVPESKPRNSHELLNNISQILSEIHFWATISTTSSICLHNLWKQAHPRLPDGPLVHSSNLSSRRPHPKLEALAYRQS